jgi:hypothetical protein
LVSFQWLNDKLGNSLFPRQRIKAYIQQQKSEKSKQMDKKESIKLFPFVKSKGNKPLNGIDFERKGQGNSSRFFSLQAI